MKWSFFLAVFFFFSMNIEASDSSNVAPLLEKVTRYQRNHKKISGNFVLQVNGSVQNGLFYYYNSEKDSSIKLLFGADDDNNDGQVDKLSYWVVHNKHLWIYLAQRHIVVDQAIPSYFLSIGSLGGGLTHYFSDYKSLKIFEKKEKSNTITILNFTKPIKPMAFDDVSIEVTAEGFQRATYATSIINNKVVKFAFTLSSVDDNASFDENKIFRVNPPGNAQILRNVLMKNR